MDKTIYFRFGSRIIGATGHESDHCHPNVLRLQLHETCFQRALPALVSFLPPALAAWVHAKFPEWCVPKRFVLKVEKEYFAEEFEMEKAAYDKLKCLQGDVIPWCYGQIQYDGRRALILSDVGGASLATPEGAVLGANDLQYLLEKAFLSLADQCVSHDDLQLDNYHLVTENGKDKIVVLDLEIVNIHMDWTKDKHVSDARYLAGFLAQGYAMHLDGLKFDRVLLPERPAKM